MSVRPGVSVVLPTFNSGSLLAPCIESILGQGYRDLEFVIVDDGSTDGTFERLADHARRDSRIVLVAEGHGGISRALNLGIERATAPLVAIMNHDDISRPDRLERQVAFFADHPEVAAAGGAMQYIDTAGNALGFAHYPTDAKAMSEALFAGWQPVGHPTLMFRREAVRALGGYRDYYAYAEDYDLLLRLAERHPLGNLPDVLLDYRLHDNTTTRQRPEQELATRYALFASRQRRAGRPDPTPAVGRADLADLARFEIATEDRTDLFVRLADAALWAASGTGNLQRLSEAERHVAQAAAMGASGTDEKLEQIAAAWRGAGRAARARRVQIAAAFSRGTRQLRRLPQGLATRGRRRREEAEAFRWLLHCTGSGEETATAGAAPTPAVGQALVSQAYWHGALAAVIARFPPFAANEAPFAPLKAEAVRRSREATALSLMLHDVAADLGGKLGGLPAMVIKGPAFSALYGGVGQRTFTDLDLLVDPAAREALDGVLRRAGFVLAESNPAAGEWKWLRRDNAAVMVEVQTDLVHMPEQRRALSLDYAGLTAGDASRATINLLVAVVHASMHQFERLRHLTDVRQAARALTSDVEVAQFAALAARTGATLAARTALRLAGGLYDEPRCNAILKALPQHPLSPLAALLITPRQLRRGAFGQGDTRTWRQKLFWRLLAIPIPPGVSGARSR